jgi:hypothetical protein
VSAFFDTNILVYVQQNGAKAVKARALLAAGKVLSVQASVRPENGGIRLGLPPYSYISPVDVGQGFGSFFGGGPWSSTSQLSNGGTTWYAASQHRRIH